MDRPAILYEDNHLLAFDKPAGWVVQGAAPGAVSLFDWAGDDLKRRYDKPGNVYLGVVHRLDGPVTGVILYAKTSKAAARLSAQFRDRSVTKIYAAIVAGAVTPESGTWTDEMTEHDGRPAIVPTSSRPTTPRSGGPGPVEAKHRDGRTAVLHYRSLVAGRGQTLLEVEPITGRKHQIRLQAASHGHPILGDERYGGRPGLGAAIALHAWRLTIEHPVRKTPLTISASLPSAWPLRADVPDRS